MSRVLIACQQAVQQPRIENK